jgi:hypothetical protein
MNVSSIFKDIFDTQAASGRPTRREGSFEDWPSLKAILHRWISENTEAAPKLYYTIAPSLALTDPRLSRVQSRRLAESGMHELLVNPPPTSENWRPLLEGILSLATGLDEGRVFYSAEPNVSEIVRAEIDSFIDGLPVIGPGGSITVYESLRQLQIDVVVRRRTEAIASAWRDADAILEGLRTKIADRGYFDERESIDLSYGYFELSKYEAQTLLRPAILCSVDRRVEIEGKPVRWQSTVVEPTTTNSDIPLEAGLGAWT